MSSAESGGVVGIEERFRSVQMDVAEAEQENEQSASSSSAFAMEAHTTAMDSQVQRRNDEQLEGHDHQPRYPRYNDAGPKAGPVEESGDALTAGSRSVIQSLFTDAPGAQELTEKSLHTDGGGGRKTLRAISSGEDSASNSEGNGGDDNAGKEENASGDDSSSSQDRHHRHNQHTLHVQRQQNKEQAQRVQERREKKHELEQHHQAMIQQRVEQQMTDQPGKEVVDESPSNGKQVQNPFHHHHHHYYHHHHYSNDEQDQPEQQQHQTQQYISEASPSTVLASPQVEPYPVHPIYHPTQDAQQQYQHLQHQQYQEQLQYQHQHQQRNQQFQHPQPLSQYESHYYQQQYDRGQLQQHQQQQNYQHQQMEPQRQYQQQPSTDMHQSQQQQQGQHHHHHVYYHQVSSAPLGRFAPSAPSAPTTAQSAPSAAPQKSVSKSIKAVAKPPVAQPAAANSASKTRIASCWTCYKKKVKCDRSRPRCGFCHARGLVCEYPSPKVGGGDEMSGAAEIVATSVTIAHQSAEKSRVSADLRAAVAAPSSTPAHPTIDTKPIADPKPSKTSFSNLLPTGSVPSPAEGGTLTGSFVPSPSHHLRAFSNVLEEGWTPSPVPDGDFSTPKHIHQRQQRGGSGSSSRNSSSRGVAGAVDAKGVTVNVTYAEMLKAGLLGGGLQSGSRSLGKNE
ncbi:hypothetical protein HDU80_007401 [Chytriomyces hyalinus]|nr:hypothetical protein HDU80_007401 [Chytriomyces hyalinus]